MLKHCIFLSIVLLLFSACKDYRVPNPKVSDDLTYEESMEKKNAEIAEQTGLTLNGEDYISIEGTFKNGKDKDQYIVELPESNEGPYLLHFIAVSKGKPLNKFMRSGFPLKLKSYKGKELLAEHAVTMSGKIRLPEEAEKLELLVNGRKVENSMVESIYADENPYALKLK
jgi:hypothetical protein